MAMRIFTPARGLIAAAAVLGGAVLLMAGPLNPPAGSVTGTYKTLTEVEPRIAINATNTPGGATAVYRISQSGSYYLTGNITGVTGKNGIEILAPGVTVDLGGFDVVGVPGSLNGVAATANGQTNMTVRNGSVRAWGGDGVNIGTHSETNCRVEMVSASNNGGNGIAVSSSAVVSNCVTWTNQGHGIAAGTGATIVNCSSNNNTGDGVSVQTGATVTNCSAWTNSGTGFSATSGCTISNCTSYQNGGSGVIVIDASTVTGCTMFQNTADGVRCGSQCSIRSNNCSISGFGSGNGAGVHCTGVDNSVDGNNCVGADRGVDVDNAGNMITHNTCSGNGVNWDVVAGNVCFVLVATPSVAVLGDSGGVSPGATNPSANYTY